jgi:MSHA biogenesis protein MshO
MTRRPYRLRRARGFTLVEAIVVIVIIGIVSAMVAVFIRAPILGYRDTVARAELTDQADLALRRMARDIRLALPNSVRVNAAGDHLEFLQTRSGARYISVEDGIDNSLALRFDDPTKTDFAALAPPASFSQARVNDYVVVTNLGMGFAPANAYDLSTTGAGNIAAITGIDAPSTATVNTDAGTVTLPVRRITLAANPFARQAIPMVSPRQRFQVVSGPVSFFCTDAGNGTFTLWRAWGYGINATQTIPTTGPRAMLATGLTRCSGLFNADGNVALQRTGLVVVAIEMQSRNADAGKIRLVHQVHVDNTP